MFSLCILTCTLYVRNSEQPQLKTGDDVPYAACVFEVMTDTSSLKYNRLTCRICSWLKAHKDKNKSTAQLWNINISVSGTLRY